MGEVGGLALNLTPVTRGAVRVCLQNLFHAPASSDAIVNAGETILGAQLEEAGKPVLDLWPR